MDGLQEAHLVEPGDAYDAEVDVIKKRREKATWYGVVGIGLLFGASFHTGFLIGGVLMVLYGATTYVWYSVRLARLYDPWKDEELDAWEDEHLGP